LVNANFESNGNKLIIENAVYKGKKNTYEVSVLRGGIMLTAESLSKQIIQSVVLDEGEATVNAATCNK